MNKLRIWNNNNNFKIQNSSFQTSQNRFTSLTPPQDLFHPFIRILSFIKLEIPTSLGRVALKAKRSRATISVNNNRAAGKSIVPHRCFISLCRSRDFSASNLHDLVWKKKEKKKESTHQWVANTNGTILSANSCINAANF